MKVKRDFSPPKFSQEYTDIIYRGKLNIKKMINLGRYFTRSLILLPGYGRKTLIPTSFFLYLFLSL